MRHAPFSVIEAPSVLGLFPAGVETMARTLLDAGFAERIHARRAGRIEPPAYSDQRDARTGLLNPESIATYTPQLANAIEQVIEAGEFPVVLGGDCSILLGCLLATRRRGRSGLLFLDGHADFYQPEAEPKGEAASMDLALATGRGPDIITNLEGRRPLVHNEDVMVFGRRDAQDAEEHGSQAVEETAIGVLDLAAVRLLGVERAMDKAFERIAASHLDGFWIHLDADVLDDAIMPAVDYRMPDGLRWNELTTALRLAIASGRAIGLDVTIFNPKLDKDGSIAAAFVDALAAGLIAGV